MKKGKIILGLATAVFTVGSALEFRLANKFTTHSVYVKTSGGKCTPCYNLFFTASGGGINPKCTINTSRHRGIPGALVAGGHKGFYTLRTIGNICLNPVTITTISD